MDKINNHFTREYMAKRLHLIWRGPIVTKIINDILKPKSVIDFGCSVGDLVKGFLDIGIPAKGVDGSEGAREHYIAPAESFVLHDLTKPLYNQKADLLISFEIYFLLSYNDRIKFIKNVARVCKRALISAPDELKDGLRDTMALHGFKQITEPTIQIRAQLEDIKHKAAVKGIYHNNMYFERH